MISVVASNTNESLNRAPVIRGPVNKSRPINSRPTLTICYYYVYTPYMPYIDDI